MIDRPTQIQHAEAAQISLCLVVIFAALGERSVGRLSADAILFQHPDDHRAYFGVRRMGDKIEKASSKSSFLRRMRRAPSKRLNGFTYRITIDLI